MLPPREESFLDEPRARAWFRRRLLEWFRRQKRDLPWRRTRDPYRIWLSEIMLQQTRVAAVQRYYRRFLHQFPDVRRLARARSERVLRLWAGLGYYRRARNLHRAAKQVVAYHQGRFPREWNAALALPGIGRYTAAAVLSIAYGQPYAVLDGNVARVLARLLATHGDLRANSGRARFESVAQQLITRSSPGDWNQAMMELGATVCTPRAPRCGICPVSRWCRAYALGIADRIPLRRAKPSPVQLTMAAAILVDPEGRTLLLKDTRGDSGGLFSRMWQFPAVCVRRDAHSELARHLRALSGGSPGAHHRTLDPLAPAKHTVTGHEIQLVPFLVRVERLPAIFGARKAHLAQLHRVPISSATQKIAAAALRHI